MKRLAISWMVAAVVALVSGTAVADDSETKLAGFVSVFGGSFNLDFPDVSPAGQEVGIGSGFEEVFGSKSGLSYGLEAGLGLADLGLFGVVRFRRWEKSGQPVTIGMEFDGEVTWTQTFWSLGGRYFLVNPSEPSRAFMPFVGLGLITSKATERADGWWTTVGEPEYFDISESLTGTGMYLEAGADVVVTNHVALRAIIEYSTLNLGYSTSYDSGKIDGGGGLFVGVGITGFFGRSLKTP